MTGVVVTASVVRMLAKGPFDGARVSAPGVGPQGDRLESSGGSALQGEQLSLGARGKARDEPHQLHGDPHVTRGSWDQGLHRRGADGSASPDGLLHLPLIGGQGSGWV